MINELNALPPTSAFGVIWDFVSRLRKPSMPKGPILVVDDEEPVLRFVERVLRESGYKTVVATSGAEAIAVARRVGPLGGLLTDLMMPGMTGDELARQLRQFEPQLKVLYLTGYSDRLFGEKTALWTDEAFLEKPCSVKGLREAVSLLLFGTLAAAS